ncbi:transposase (plasmid) [Streptomyces sp. QH1-20]|uniref:IS110 family transposase n=1 Tax=Streptomyces sp. QH1-20 TaxID=3240934 RepID=UPI00351366CC
MARLNHARRIAGLHPREAKTDARAADTTRTTPHTLRSTELDDETAAEFHMTVGFHHELTAEVIWVATRLRGLLSHIPPHVGRALRPYIQTPKAIRKASSRRRLVTLLRPKNPRMVLVPMRLTIG